MAETNNSTDIAREHDTSCSSSSSTNSSDLDDSWAFISTPSNSPNRHAQLDNERPSQSEDYAHCSTSSRSHNESGDSWVKCPKLAQQNGSENQYQDELEQPKRSLSLNDLNERNNDFYNDGDALHEIDLNEPQLSLRDYWTKYLTQMHLGLVPLDPLMTRERVNSLIENNLLEGKYEDYFPPRETYKETTGNIKHSYPDSIDGRQPRKRHRPSSPRRSRDVQPLQSTIGLFRQLTDSSRGEPNELWNRLVRFLTEVPSLVLTISVFLILAQLSFTHFLSLPPKPASSRHFEPSDWSKKFGKSDDMINLVKNIPQNYEAYYELQRLQDELSQCIKRQSPSSFKYYMSEDRNENYHKSEGVPSLTQPLKSYKGLVCFGQEQQWRQRLDKLKSELDLDLRRIVQDVRRYLTSELLEHYHPSLKFKLIVNQIEYLDFLEAKRNKKHIETTMKQLKTENLQIMRRANEPDNSNYQKLILQLEIDNAKLVRENRALKDSLMEKAGTTYIRQSMELEKCEKENDILRQFHKQVSQDASKALKQFNLYTVETPSNLDDTESLKSQLMLTRGYMRRLNEEVGGLLIENAALKEELKESHMLSIISSDYDNEHNQAQLSFPISGGANDSNALSADSCLRDLHEQRKRSYKLEEEIEQLKKRDCCSNKSLERGTDRHLNKTQDADNTTDYGQNLIGAWNRLSSSGTELLKSVEDAFTSGASEMMRDIMLFMFEDFETGVSMPDTQTQLERPQTISPVGDRISRDSIRETNKLTDYTNELRRSKRQKDMIDTITTDDDPFASMPPDQKSLLSKQHSVNEPIKQEYIGDSFAKSVNESLQQDSSNKNVTKGDGFHQMSDPMASCEPKSQGEVCICVGEFQSTPNCILSKKTPTSKDKTGFVADWLIKRSKLREKLRRDSSKYSTSNSKDGDYCKLNGQKIDFSKDGKYNSNKNYCKHKPDRKDSKYHHTSHHQKQRHKKTY